MDGFICLFIYLVSFVLSPWWLITPKMNVTAGRFKALLWNGQWLMSDC